MFLNPITTNNNIDNNEVLSLYDVNIRWVYAMRATGEDIVAAEFFCGIMNFPAPTSKFEPMIKILGSTTAKSVSAINE